MAAKVELHTLSVAADRSVAVLETVPIVAGSVYVDEVDINFEEPEDWQDLSLLLTFIHTNGTSVQMSWDGPGNRVLIPWEVTQDTGMIGISIVGSIGEVSQRGLTQSAPNLLSVVTPGTNVGDAVSEPTAEAIDKLFVALSQVDGAISSLETAQEQMTEAVSTARKAANQAAGAASSLGRWLPFSAGNIVTGELSGTNSTSSSCADAYPGGEIVSIELEGRSRQSSGVGKNYMPKLVPGTYTNAGVTAVVDDNSLVTLSGTATGGGPIIPTEHTAEYRGTNFYWHIRNNIAMSSGSITLQPTTDTFGGPNLAMSPSNRISYTSGGSMISEIGSIRLWIANGVNTDGLTFQLSLELNNDVTDYEPYTGGKNYPCPEFPQEVESIQSGNLYLKDAKSTNQNVFSLFPKIKIPFELELGTIVGGSNTYLNFLYSDTKVANNSRLRTATLLPNTGTIDPGNNYDAIAFFYDSQGRSTAKMSGWYSEAFTPSSINTSPYVAFVFRSRFDIDAEITPATVGDEITYTKSLTSLRSLPNGTHDTLTINRDGSGTITRRVGRYILNSGTSPNASNQLGEYYRLSYSLDLKSVAASNGSGYSNKLVWLANYEQQSEHYYNDVNVLVVFVEASTRDEAVSILGDFEFYYVLATPVTETIPSYVMPRVLSQYLTTRIDTLDQNGKSLATEYSLTYEKSLQAIISQINKAVDLGDYEPDVVDATLATLKTYTYEPITDDDIYRAVFSEETYGSSMADSNN